MSNGYGNHETYLAAQWIDNDSNLTEQIDDYCETLTKRAENAYEPDDDYRDGIIEDLAEYLTEMFSNLIGWKEMSAIQQEFSTFELIDFDEIAEDTYTYYEENC